jgi:hypothetical protein
VRKRVIAAGLPVDEHRHFSYLLFHRFGERAQPRQHYQLLQSNFTLSPGQACDLRHNLSNGRLVVPQPRQDRNYIIPDLIAFDQAVSVQLADIESPIPLPYIGAANFTSHSQRRRPDIEQDLAREFAEQPKHSEAIFCHAKRHSGIVRALQFYVDEIPHAGLSQKVHAQILYLRQFDIEPLLNVAASRSRIVSLADPCNRSFKATSSSCMYRNPIPRA